MAQAHDLMDTFALFLGRDGEPAQYARVAEYYESKALLEQAADFYERAEHYNKALRLYLQELLPSEFTFAAVLNEMWSSI
jgi:hypothetical protein